MRLFERAQVIAIEQTEPFQVDVTARAAAREASLARAQRLRDQALAMAHDIPVYIPSWDAMELERLARDHLCSTAVELRPRHLRDRAPPVAAVCVHYLIGWASIAEESLHPLWPCPGWTDARLALRIRMILAIAIRYPQLRDACNLEMRRLVISPDDDD